MKRYLTVGWLIILCVSSLWAQEMTASDIKDIQQRALRNVRQFEGTLNLIAQPNEYLRENNVDELIRGQYQLGLSSQIFRDSLAVIENDLSLHARLDNSDSLTVSEYLTLFASVYEKSPASSVFFNNYEVSPVRQQGKYVYVDVRYTSEFTNGHQSYPNQSFPLRRKQTTCTAQRRDGSWQVAITRIVNLPPVGDGASPSTNVFTQVPRVYRPGKTYTLPIRVNPEAPPSSLILYRNEEQVEDLSRILTDSMLTWKVPRPIARRGDYRFRLYDPVSGKVIESSPFTIKKGFP